MRRFSHIGLVCSLAIVAPSATAQEPLSEPGTDDGNEIVVKGERIIEITSATELAQTVADRPQSREPLARFRTPLCLLLAIDDPDRARMIGRRIIANARAANLEIARRGCRPNALVIIADDMRGKIEEHRRSGRRFFGRLKRHQIDRALNVPDPVYVFQDIEVRTNTRGQIDKTARKNVLASSVMIDNGATAGLSHDQIADYATMRLLAPSREVGEVAEGMPRTIATLFRDGDVALTQMSAFDRAYLAALYRIRINANAVQVVEMAMETLTAQAAPALE